MLHRLHLESGALFQGAMRGRLRFVFDLHVAIAWPHTFLYHLRHCLESLVLLQDLRTLGPAYPFRRYLRQLFRLADFDLQ